MSADQSFLSDRKYGYDMVVATTQASVNATMMEWLDKLESRPFIQAYLEKGGAVPEPADFEKLKQDIGANPLDIPAGTPASDQRIARLLQARFSSAFIADIGFPDDLPSPYPAVIEFKKEGALVTFNLVCRTFRLVALSQAPGKDPQWVNMTQDDSSAPWIFSFSVPLNSRKEKAAKLFHSLPERTQLLIGGGNSGMFSVQKLLLDLPSAVLNSEVNIAGVPPSAYPAFYAFLKAYMLQLSKREEVVLGYSLLNDQPDAAAPSLVPTDVSFIISAHKDAQGQPTTNYHAYTLNYLIMTNGRSMPPASPFAWNWIEKDKTTLHSGVMAVNRSRFTGYLYNALRSPVKHITIYPEVSLSCFWDHSTMRWGFKEEPTEQPFNGPQEGNVLLRYDYFRRSISESDSTYMVPPFHHSGTFELKYNAHLAASITPAGIELKTQLDAWLYLRVSLGKAEGKVLSKSLGITYTIGVNAAGKIVVTRQPLDIKEGKHEVHTNDIFSLFSLGQVNQAIESITASLNAAVDRSITNEAAAIDVMLNGPHSFVFPGGKTFSFTDANFSDHQDLVANLLYVAPKLKRYNAQ